MGSDKGNVYKSFVGIYAALFLLGIVGLAVYGLQVHLGKNKPADIEKAEVAEADSPSYQKNETQEVESQFVEQPTKATNLVEATVQSVSAAASETSVERINRGESLFNANCAACHQLGAEGKVGFAPSIRNRDFLALASDEFIKKTIAGGRPGTAMPPRPDLSDHQINGIVAYLRSLPVTNPVVIQVDPHKSHIGNVEAGKASYNIYCASCHGEEGHGYSDGGSGPGIGLPGFLGVASDDYIYQTLKYGRIGTPMKSFIGPSGLANLSDGDAADIITYLRSLQTVEKGATPTFTGAGDPRKGEEHFNINCAACHQIGGEGKIGFAPSIRNRDFLAIASNDFILQTVTNGRPGTAMVARPDLSEKILADIIAYLRALPVANDLFVTVDPYTIFNGDKTAGKEKFEIFCASCHGPEGQGYAAGVSGPGIGLPGFLKAASDDYIYQTLKLGRVGTPMKPFIGPKGVANLSDEDVYDITTYLRSLLN